MKDRWSDYIIGKGQVGQAIGAILENSSELLQYIDPKYGLEPDTALPPIKDTFVVMHICYPWSESFIGDMRRYICRFNPDVVIIHSTVKPDESCNPDVVYSPIRGQHDKLVFDLKRYTKYMASPRGELLVLAKLRFESAGIKVRTLNSDIRTLEWAKHLSNTLYYHWMIGYRQLVHQWCKELSLDEDALWSFTKELYEFTGIQYPSYYDPKGVGGHCVLQNTKMLITMREKPDSMSAVLDLLLFVNNEVMEGEKNE